MKVKISELFQIFKEQGMLLEQIGPDGVLENISIIEKTKQGELCFLSNNLNKPISYIEDKRGICVVLDAKFAKENIKVLSELSQKNQITFLLSSNVNVAQALIRQKYVERDWQTVWPRIHPSAVVHESTKIPESVQLGPNVVIGSNVKLGERVRVGAGTIIEHGSEIGEDTVFHPNVFVAYETLIGKKCIVYAGSVIGSDGFGFAQDEKRNNYRIPQTGRVRIGDRVVIGALCAIDRASYSETIIEDGVIFDNFVHIGHNCVIGENSIIVACTGIGGSTKVGKRVLMAGNTAVADHLEIVDDTYFLYRAGIAQNVDKPGTYGGVPLQPIKDLFRTNVVIKELPELKKRILALERKLEAMDKN